MIGIILKYKYNYCTWFLFTFKVVMDVYFGSPPPLKPSTDMSKVFAVYMLILNNK